MNIYPIQKYNQKNKYTFILFSVTEVKVLRKKILHGEAFFNSLLFNWLKHKTQIYDPITSQNEKHGPTKTYGKKRYKS